MFARENKSSSHLSEVDRKILKNLLTPDGNVNSQELAKELGIPITTVR